MSHSYEELRSFALKDLLVISEETLLRHVLKEALRQSGYRIAEAATAWVARLWLRRGWRTVLLDERLGDADSLTLLSEIRENHPAALLLLMTADRSVASVTRAVAAGASGVVAKPIDPLALLQALDGGKVRRPGGG